MTYKAGKFYNEVGDAIPLEFGNKDQIDLMKKAEALNEGVLAYIDESGDDDETALEYTCLCGCRFRREYKLAEWNEFQKDNFTCAGCGCKYILDGEKFDPFVIVKFDKSKKRN
jgi:hypothetical protein